jgi:hypothetical protein
MIKTLQKIEGVLVQQPKTAERDEALKGIRTAIFHIGNMPKKEEPEVSEAVEGELPLKEEPSKK